MQKVNIISCGWMEMESTIYERGDGDEEFANTKSIKNAFIFSRLAQNLWQIIM